MEIGLNIKALKIIILLLCALPAIVLVDFSCYAFDTGDIQVFLMALVSGPQRPNSIQESVKEVPVEEAPVVIEEELPDLTVLDLNIDAWSRKITARIANLSGDSMLKNIKVSFYYYQPKGEREYRKKIRDKRIKRLEYGRQNAVTLSVIVSTDMIYKRLQVIVDPDSDIKEKNERNNSLENKIKGPPPPGYLDGTYDIHY